MKRQKNLRLGKNWRSPFSSCLKKNILYGNALSLKKEDIISHDSYVKELLRYIIKDLVTFRPLQGDSTLGGMITAKQVMKLRCLSMKQ